MIDQIHGQYYVTCDGCEELLTFVPGFDFDDVLSYLKYEKWKSIKIGDDWCHYCPKCKGKFVGAMTDFADC